MVLLLGLYLRSALSTVSNNELQMAKRSRRSNPIRRSILHFQFDLSRLDLLHHPTIYLEYIRLAMNGSRPKDLFVCRRHLGQKLDVAYEDDHDHYVHYC